MNPKAKKDPHTENDSTQNNRNGWISLISGITTLVLIIMSHWLALFFAIAFAVIALIWGIRGIRHDRKKGMAWAGTILGSLAVAGVIITILLLALLF